MRRVAALLLLVLLGLSGAPLGEAEHHAPIQPGAVLGNAVCTMNFVYRDAAGALYIGTAGHCAPPVGERMISPEIGDFGTVVYRRTYSGAISGQTVMDYALIRIDPTHYGSVDPAVRFWGGPTGVASEDPAPGSLVLHHGYGVQVSATEPTRSRVGVFERVAHAGPWSGWWSGWSASRGGDSGSAVLTEDGRALGTANTVAVLDSSGGQQAAILSGPSIPFVLATLRAAGFDLTLVTAPFDGALAPVALLSRAETMIEHCAARPIAMHDSPDGCVAPTMYYYHHAVSPSDPATEWALTPTPAGAVPDPRLCPQPAPYPYFTSPCQEDVLHVDVGSGASLGIEISWPDAANDLDLYLVAPSGDTIASSTSKSGKTERVDVPDVEPGAYRVIVVPAHYVAAGMWDPETRASAALTFG